MKRRYFEELTALLRLAVPLTVALLAQIGIAVIDSIMMGYLGPQALAAGALALGTYMLVLVFSLGLVSAVSVCIAQAKGAQQHQAITRYLQQGIYFIVMISVPMLLLLWHMASLLLLLQQKAAVVHLVERFLHGLMWGYPSILGFMLLREFVSNFNKTTIVVIVSLCALPINGFLDYVFIFGAFHFPRWGMFGIGMASSLIEWAMLLVMIIYVLRQQTVCHYVRQPLQSFQPVLIKELFRIGTPTGFIYLFEAGLFSVAALMMGWLGTMALAAYQIIFQCLDVAFMFFLGTAQATALRVAQHIGAKHYYKLQRTLAASMTLGLCLASLMAIIFYFAATPLIYLFVKANYANDNALIALAQQYFKMVVIFVFFDATQVICSSGLRGMKDTFIPMWVGLGSYWLVGISAAYLFAFLLGFAGVGLWSGLNIGIATSGLIMLWRWVIMIKRYKIRPI